MVDGWDACDGRAGDRARHQTDQGRRRPTGLVGWQAAKNLLAVSREREVIYYDMNGVYTKTNWGRKTDSLLRLLLLFVAVDHVVSLLWIAQKLVGRKIASVFQYNYPSPTENAGDRARLRREREGERKGREREREDLPSSLSL